MSAGNIVLYSQAINTTTYPTTTPLLGSGNYWIEEIDLTVAYATTSAATSGTPLIYQLTYGAIVFWYVYFLIPSTSGAVNVPMNLIVISRPRIFLPRNQTVSLSVIGGSVLITSAVNTINLYGHSLP